MLALAVSRRTLAFGVLLGCLLTLGWLLFGESDEQRILTNLRELGSAVGTREGESIMFRTARINKAFKALLHPDVTLDAPELGRAQGIPQLAMLAVGAQRGFGDFEVSVAETEVDLDRKSKQARVTARITLEGGRGEFRRDTRTARFHYMQHEGEWKAYGIEVAAQTHEEPEARP